MSNFEQAKARIHRVSQTENCLYIYLTAKHTVDTKILRALRDKADLAKMLVDDYRNGINPFQEEFEMQTQNMYELAEQLKQLREKKKNAEQRLKEMNAEIEQADYQLSMLMAETETQNFTRAGTTFALTTKIRASAVAGRKEELYAALKENGCGDLVYETVNANSLSAFVKEQIAENQDTVPEWLSGLVHVYEQTSVSVRQSAK